MVTDVLALRLIPSSKIRMVRMIPQNNHSPSRAGNSQCCQLGFQGKPGCCRESVFLKKTEENPDLN